MRKIRRISMLGILGISAAMVALAAQQDDPQPTCNHCPASYISSSEIQAYVKRAIANGLIDQQVRSVDLGKTQTGIGLVYRGKITPSTPAEAVAEHDLVSEVYYVMDGSGTLETGPDMVDVKRRPSTLETVRERNGPGHGAASIRNPKIYELKTGDMVIIPAGTGHWFTKIDDHITYVMVRIDPDKAVPLRDEAASKAYLASPAKPAQ